MFEGRLGIIQRVLPTYRVPFFQMLAGQCEGGLSLLSGQARVGENIAEAETISGVHWVQTKNLHLFKGKAYACWQPGLTRWLNDWQPDVLIVEANPRYLSTPRAVAWMHRHHKPVIGWGLGARPSSGWFDRLSEFSRRHFIKQFDAMITYSKTGAHEYTQIGLDPQSIFVAVNAVTARPQKPAPQRPMVPQGKVKVLFVGRLQARKRVENLIHACANLPTSLQPGLWIVGDGEERSRLEIIAQKIYPATVFTGAKFGDELDDLFEQADLFVLPGTGGLAIQQAMSHALPVIVAEADGTQGNLVKSQNGWQVSPGDLDALSNTLAEALRDIPRLRQMGVESYRMVNEEINLEAMVAVFLEAIHYAQGRVK